MLAVLIVCGCDAAPHEDVIRRDSASVVIIESPDVLARSPLPWTVDSLPELTIGAVEADEPYQLFRIAGVAQLPDGRILVVNAGTQELRFFDGEGRFVSSVGRSGSGPGEYTFPQLIPSITYDSLWIFDRASRLVVLDPSGQILKTIAPAPRLSSPIGVLAGRLVTSQGSARARPDSPEGMLPNDITYEMVDLSPESRDTIAEIPGFALFLSNQGGAFGFTTVPFDVPPSAAVGEQRFYIAPGEDPEVLAFDSSGQLREIFRILQRAEPLSQTEFDRVVAEQVGRARDQAAAAELRRRYAKMPRPSFTPMFQSLVIDSDGHLWLEVFRAVDAQRPEWVVLDPAGEVLGRISTPIGVRIAQIGGDYILGLTRGPSDIEQVVRYRLHRS